jgi:hypothetical protein
MVNREMTYKALLDFATAPRGRFRIFPELCSPYYRYL